VVALRGTAADGGDLADYRGAARGNPWLGAALVLAFAGLAGLPPGLSGLFAKVTIVAALINAGWGWLAGVVALNAVIALAYYVRVTALLYARPTTVGIPFADLPATEGGPQPTATTPAETKPPATATPEAATSGAAASGAATPAGGGAAADKPAIAAPASAESGATMTAVVDPDLLEAATHPRADVPRTVAAAIVVAAVITIVLGFAPQWIFDALIG
jgi:formate hydrogenlyase subunit 3/multisubunit Na+/H+ antiporter MnhD subunit